MFSGPIERCYDSHVHWLATGQIQQTLNLSGLKAAEDVFKLDIKPHHHRGEWLVGFGWDQNLWPKQQFPTREVLDRLDPNRPISFSRADGHAAWINTTALNLLPPEILHSPDVLRDPITRTPTGVLLDRAKQKLDALIPKPSRSQVREYLLSGARIFNRAGFTHIRDMTATAVDWEEAYQLDQQGLLTMAVESFFKVETLADLSSALAVVMAAKKRKSPNLSAKGIKIFLDGALGSDGAWLSAPYRCSHNHGISLFSEHDLKDLMMQTWEKDLELAIHVIGDEAADFALKAALDTWQKRDRGVLHLEHVEVLRPETIQRLAGRRVTCHLQPCHWLSDRFWLKQKLPNELLKCVFPWRALEEANVPFYFGSDSPIAPPSVSDNWKALKESEGEIAKLQGPFPLRHTHPDPSWGAQSQTLFVDGKPSEIQFRGRRIHID